MTTIADARAELTTALEAADLVVAPALGRVASPYAIAFGAGIDAAHILRGQVEAGLRVMLVSGRADQAASFTDLSDMILATVGAIRALAGWRLGTIGADTIRVIIGIEYLTADVVAHRFVTPS